LIEEAAQILESHVIASITKHTEHLIMIGDHQQLRPINSEYSFKELYNIDVSLMERLINSGISYVRLNVQHRMRPEVRAQFILQEPPAIYHDSFPDC
jgi:superfamily I DNA and/or RNA helicase